MLKVNEQMQNKYLSSKNKQQFYQLMSNFNRREFDKLYQYKYNQKIHIIGISSSQLKTYKPGYFVIFLKNKVLFFDVVEYKPLKWYKKEALDVCISYPGIYERKPFPKKVCLSYYVSDRIYQQKTFTGKICKIIHHEMQHSL